MPSWVHAQVRYRVARGGSVEVEPVLVIPREHRVLRVVVKQAVADRRRLDPAAPAGGAADIYA